MRGSLVVLSDNADLTECPKSHKSCLGLPPLAVPEFQHLPLGLLSISTEQGEDARMTAWKEGCSLDGTIPSFNPQWSLRHLALVSFPTPD